MLSDAPRTRVEHCCGTVSVLKVMSEPPPCGTRHTAHGTRAKVDG